MLMVFAAFVWTSGVQCGHRPLLRFLGLDGCTAEGLCCVSVAVLKGATALAHVRRKYHALIFGLGEDGAEFPGLAQGNVRVDARGTYDVLLAQVLPLRAGRGAGASLNRGTGAHEVVGAGTVEPSGTHQSGGSYALRLILTCV